MIWSLSKYPYTQFVLKVAEQRGSKVKLPAIVLRFIINWWIYRSEQFDWPFPTQWFDIYMWMSIALPRHTSMNNKMTPELELFRLISFSFPPSLSRPGWLNPSTFHVCLHDASCCQNLVLNIILMASRLILFLRHSDPSLKDPSDSSSCRL